MRVDSHCKPNLSTTYKAMQWGTESTIHMSQVREAMVQWTCTAFLPTAEDYQSLQELVSRIITTFIDFFQGWFQGARSTAYSPQVQQRNVNEVWNSKHAWLCISCVCSGHKWWCIHGAWKSVKIMHHIIISNCYCIGFFELTGMHALETLSHTANTCIHTKLRSF